MIPATCLLLGLILGAAGVWLLQRPELDRLRKDKAVAEDRLFYAWRDEKVMPAPRPIDVKPVEPLPPPLQECVDEWEPGSEARATEERNIRQKLEQGWGIPAIIKARENHHP